MFPPLRVGWTVDDMVLLLLLVVLVPEMRRGVVECGVGYVCGRSWCVCGRAHVGMCVSLSLGQGLSSFSWDGWSFSSFQDKARKKLFQRKKKKTMKTNAVFNVGFNDGYGC